MKYYPYYFVDNNSETTTRTNIIIIYDKIWFLFEKMSLYSHIINLKL